MLFEQHHGSTHKLSSENKTSNSSSLITTKHDLFRVSHIIFQHTRQSGKQIAATGYSLGHWKLRTWSMKSFFVDYYYT